MFDKKLYSTISKTGIYILHLYCFTEPQAFVVMHLGVVDGTRKNKNKNSAHGMWVCVYVCYILLSLFPNIVNQIYYL